MLSDFYGNDVHKVLYGSHAMHLPCQMMLQRQGEVNGKHVTVAMVVLVTDEPVLSQEAMDNGCMHELIIGDMVVRPAGKWASKKYHGKGLTGLLKSDAMFPNGHEFHTLDNGYQDTNTPLIIP